MLLLSNTFLTFHPIHSPRRITRYVLRLESTFDREKKRKRGVPQSFKESAWTPDPVKSI